MYKQVIKIERLFFLAIILTLSSFISFAFAQVKITGKITDPDKMGLPGAAISIKGTTEGTISDSEGNYNILAESGNVLVFSFVGCTSEEVEVGNDTVINIELLPDLLSLEKVVVVGYGTQRKKEITGSIAIADEELVEKDLSPVLSSRLQGVMPGVKVTNTGEPGALPDIKIRGNVFTGVDGDASVNNPLFVVDGILTTDNRFLNPNDIESIQVLKDASSSSIYGSRAANGVIIITTKKGKVGKPKVDFTASYGVQEIPNQIELANTEQWAWINRANYYNVGGQPDLYADSLYDPNRYTDWQKEMTKRGALRDINLSFSSGNENGRIFFSFNNSKQEGVVGDPVFERYSARVNSELNFGKKLTVGQNLNVGRTILSSPQGSLEAIYEMLPVVPVYDTANASGYGYGDDTRARTFASNPKGLEDLIYNRTTGTNILGNAFIRFTPIEGLQYQFNASIDLDLSHTKTYNEEAQISRSGTMQSGLSELNEEYVSYFLEHKLSYGRTFGKHTFSVMGSYVGQQEKFTNHGTAISGGYTFDQNFWVIDASTAPLNNYSHEGKESTHAIESYLGRITYDFDDRYLLNMMLRYDGSSRFLDDVRWGTFPSASAGWIVSNEKFFPDVMPVNFFKLRAGYGEVGNSTGIDYIYQSELIRKAIGGVNYNLGPEGRSVLGVTRGKLANERIRWETLKEFNFGTDIYFLDNRLELVFDYFIGKTEDLIYKRSIPQSVGAEQDYIIENIIGIKRNGWELSLVHKNNIGGFSYKVSANLSYMESKLDKLVDEIPYITDAPDDPDYAKARSFINQPVGQFFLHDYQGIYTQEDIDNLPDNFLVYNLIPQVGDAKYIDRGSDPNGEFGGLPDGKINEFDRVPVGKTNPLQYGFSFSGSFKGFDMLVFFQGVTHFDVYNNWYEYLNTNDFSNYTADFHPYFEGEGTDPRAVFGFTHFNKRPSTRYLESGAYFRLKNLQIGYTFKINKVNNFRVYLGGQNLITWTKYRGLDVEFTGPMFAPGDDPRNFPNLRTYSVGLSLSF